MGKFEDMMAGYPEEDFCRCGKYLKGESGVCWRCERAGLGWIEKKIKKKKK